MRLALTPLAVGAICAAAAATALRIAWNPPFSTYLEYVPIATVSGLLVWDRLFPTRLRSRRAALADALVFGLASMRVLVPPLPFMSGHTLVAGYSALTARGGPLRVISSLVLVHILYVKMFASPGWFGMLTGLGGAGLLAALHRPPQESRRDPAPVGIGESDNFESRL